MSALNINKLKSHPCNNGFFDDRQCEICKFDLTELLEIHHILPLQQGGDNSLDNISYLCPNCHRIIHEFISHFCNGTDINEIIQWMKENYSKSACDKIVDMYKKYTIKKNHAGKINKHGFKKIKKIINKPLKERKI